MSVDFNRIAATMMSQTGSTNLARKKELVPVVVSIIEEVVGKKDRYAVPCLKVEDANALVLFKILERGDSGRLVVHSRWNELIQSTGGGRHRAPAVA